MRHLFLLALVGCGTSTNATYHRDVRPLMEANCVTCHSGDATVAPYDFSSYESVASYAPLIVAAVEEKIMPPWGYDPGCNDIVGLEHLSDDEIALFTAWAERGYPEGRESDYVAPEVTPYPTPDRDPDVIAAMDGYLPDRGLSDDYRCVQMGAPTTEDLFVSATRVRPGNLAVAHHAILYAMPPSQRDLVDRLEAEDPEEGYECFGGPGAESGEQSEAMMITGWAPGGEGFRPLPDGVALRIPAGSQLVLQMHYNTLGATGVDADDVDSTAVDLWTYPAGVLPDELVTAWPIVKLDLDIAAYDSESVQIQRQRMPLDGRILASSPHMHVRGVSQETTLIREDGEEICLANIPQYNFQWQRGYAFSEPIEVGWADEFRIRCTYDNSSQNQPGGETPVDITWGEGTFDEMCLNFVSVATPFYGDGSGEVCDGFEQCMATCDAGDLFCRTSCMSSASDSCFSCGVASLFSECAQTGCESEYSGFYDCMFGEAPTTRERFLHAMYECRAATNAYWACAEQRVDAGDCAADYVDCPELSGLATR
ncbi:MAG: hypothetical protein EP330_04925 [Deltaproteobacteria bacterium]|nr:MAG: hypothetical protein EP330_04925 [Deltaproteobacteria bacterium]